MGKIRFTLPPKYFTWYETNDTRPKFVKAYDGHEEDESRIGYPGAEYFVRTARAVRVKESSKIDKD